MEHKLLETADLRRWTRDFLAQRAAVALPSDPDATQRALKQLEARRSVAFYPG